MTLNYEKAYAIHAVVCKYRHWDMNGFFSISLIVLDTLNLSFLEQVESL
jgi:hypothetical protein